MNRHQFSLASAAIAVALLCLFLALLRCFSVTVILHFSVMVVLYSLIVAGALAGARRGLSVNPTLSRTVWRSVLGANIGAVLFFVGLGAYLAAIDLLGLQDQTDRVSKTEFVFFVTFLYGPQATLIGSVLGGLWWVGARRST